MTQKTQTAESRDEAIERMRVAYRLKRPSIPNETIADRMRRARMAADVDRESIAWFVGVEPNTVSRWENHWSPQPPAHHKLELWAIYCGVSLAWLLTGEGSTSTIWYRRSPWSRTACLVRSAA